VGSKYLALTCVLVFGVLLGTSSTASAQLNSNEGSVALAATLLESLTVAVAPGTVNFSLTSGSATNAGSAPLVVTTTWALTVGRTNLKVYAYFDSASAALAHSDPLNSVDIPSSRFEVSVNGGANQALNQTVAFGAASAGRQLVSQNLSVLTIAGSRADTVDLNINLNSYVLPADVYVGTLHIRAQATP
jgi:hypothetical protein